MKNLLLATIILLISLNHVSASGPPPASLHPASRDTSYMVVVDTYNRTSMHRTPNIDHVNAIMHNYFPSSVNAEDYFGDGNYFEIRNYKYRFYVEKKRVVRKRNGEAKYKKLNKIYVITNFNRQKLYA